MADQKFTLNVDDDWKRQAQEEKRRLAEQEAKNKQAAAPASAPAAGAAEPTEAAGDAEAVDETSPFGGLVRTLLTQTLVYLGAGQRQGMPMNLDAARRSLDFLGVLDEKGKGNLSPDEQKLLDTALYQARNQFVAVASQLLGP
jgi:hypothetical protein